MGAKPRPAAVTNGTNATALPTGLVKDYLPDLLLSDPRFGEREVGLDGGKPPLTLWPNIRRMWWGFKNPVSGRVPEWYSPGCVPCKVRPDWALETNRY